ncbi:MAG TPA: M23 family metallopeptidase [Clostridiales bacterium]|jgi:murein DD-endopeptidase MepM/ murein hydrolase activator NlpD|nr:M23 family metallopeptidase [Clostridiales bacterium]
MKKIVVFSLIFILLTALCSEDCSACGMKNTVYADGGYIKWIDFNVTYRALCDALKVDIETHGSSNHVGWVEILAYLASRNGGNFSSYKSSDTKKLLEKISDGSSVASHVTNEKLYKYYLEAYGAILGDMVGEYTEVRVAPDGSETRTQEYGLRAFSPIAAGYYYGECDDFGNARSFGYKRQHLGHDLMGSVGTPVIAVESGYVEAAGWNRFGGWRIGIRSFDGRRYYYYAHLRKNHPYNDIYEGKIVNAGEVIGYLGMTGYSSKENTNNIRTPHLHWGLQIIFDSSQKEGWNQIWIDLYALTRFLTANRAPVYKKDGEYYSKVYFEYPETPD